jgi:hypothetical protein
MRVVIALVAISFLMMSQSAFAQGGQKKSCAEFCVEYCQKNASHRNYCMNECPSKCEATRAGKKK